MVGRPSHRALHAFVETVNGGSAAAAGRRLGVSASAVSHLIKELERRLATRLFVAGPNSGLTEAGRRLQHGVGAAFVAIDRALSDLNGIGTEVRLSTVATFANLWLLPRLPDFARHNPDLRLTISNSRQVVKLGTEPFDCSIRWGRGDWPDATSHLLFRESLILVGARPPIAGEDALALPRIAALTRPDDWPLYLAAAGATFRQPHLVVEDRAAAVQAATLGLGVTVIDGTLAAHAIAAGRLLQLAGTACPLEDGFYFVTSRSISAREPVARLGAWIKQAARGNPNPAKLRRRIPSARP
jgi:LysR family glycine cleavage system transcriptional activator